MKNRVFLHAEGTITLNSQFSDPVGLLSHQSTTNPDRLQTTDRLNILLQHCNLMTLQKHKTGMLHRNATQNCAKR